MFSIADFDAAKEMLIQVLKGLDESTIQTIILENSCLIKIK